MKALEQQREVPVRGRAALRAIEILISRVLFWGALIGITIAALGLVIYVLAGGLGTNLQDRLRQQTANNPEVFASVPQMFATLKTGSNPLAVIDLGLVLLLMVPVFSVALLVPAFLKQGDYRYAIIAAVILLILLFGLVFGGA
jgi:uncharacterized membrane protein